MREALLKTGKKFAGFDVINGVVFVNYYVKTKLHTEQLNNNFVFNVREIRLLTAHLDTTLTLINKLN